MRHKIIKSAFAVVCMTLLAVASASVTATVLWGSPAAGIAVLRGEFLSVDGTTKSFGSMRSDATAELDFALTNLSRQSVRIIGGDGSCDCTIVDDIPTVIGPRSRKDILIRVRLKGKQGPFQQTVRLYTSSPRQPEILLTIRGDVIQSEARALFPGGMPLLAFPYRR